jgi:hypothetical protein
MRPRAQTSEPQASKKRKQENKQANNKETEKERKNWIEGTQEE